MVVLLDGACWADPGAQHDVDWQAGGFPEAVQAQVTGVSEAWDEAESEEIEPREHELTSYVTVGCLDLARWLGCVERAGCIVAGRVRVRSSGGATIPSGGRFTMRGSAALYDERVSDSRESSMRVRRVVVQGAGDLGVELLDDVGEPVAIADAQHPRRVPPPATSCQPTIRRGVPRSDRLVSRAAGTTSWASGRRAAQRDLRPVLFSHSLSRGIPAACARSRNGAQK